METLPPEMSNSHVEEPTIAPVKSLEHRSKLARYIIDGDMEMKSNVQGAQHRAVNCTDDPLTVSEEEFTASAKGIYGPYACMYIHTQVNK